jgi:hypothetical protein
MLTMLRSKAETQPLYGTCQQKPTTSAINASKNGRAALRAQPHSFYVRLYGLNNKQLRYILDPHGLSQRDREDILDPWEGPTCAGAQLLPEEPAVDFPSETFRVLKEKEKRLYGEYRTRRLVLEAWERLSAEA